jgi:hypothetical protein
MKGDALPVFRLNALPPRVELDVERYFLEAHRCDACGYLLFFANQRA